MERFDISREELLGMLTQLEQAYVNHLQWYNGVIRTITCKLPIDPHETSPRAHHACRFGQWYGSMESDLHVFSSFLPLGKEHERMHQVAARLLAGVRDGKPVTAPDFDEFAGAIDLLRLQISAFKSELENLLYNHDPLTGAINRLGILPALREQTEIAKRGIQTCCLSMMDIDRFKDINDRFGHAGGDRVLRATVHFIIEHLRPYDKIFRYGGEEFLLLLQHTELAQCSDILERVREGIASASIDLGGGQSISITASFGVALLAPDVPVETSIERADKAMYAAKAAGRNCVRIWDSAAQTQ
jgi:diguanylate cyclase (GGDEF)-like protein